MIRRDQRQPRARQLDARRSPPCRRSRCDRGAGPGRGPGRCARRCAGSRRRSTLLQLLARAASWSSPRIHSLKSPSTIFGPGDVAVARRSSRAAAPDGGARGSPCRGGRCRRAACGRATSMSTRCMQRGSHVFHDRSCCEVVRDREAAEHDVAELVAAQLARRRHHPAHAERGADLLGVAAAVRPGADHFLQRDDVGVDRAQHRGDPLRARAAVQAAAAMDVVGGDAQRRGRRRGHYAMIVPCLADCRGRCDRRKEHASWRASNRSSKSPVPAASPRS